jgi:hypothetical protein
LTSTGVARLPRRRPRQELAGVLLLGLAGAGLVLLAMRQDWAHVTITVPRPLPASTAGVTGQDLVPAADALAVAAAASLAAVLATRRTLRRITGIFLAGIGAGIALTVSASISAGDVLAAAAGTAGPGTGSGAGSAADSVTAGGTQGSIAAPLTGFPGHAALAALPWRGVALAGALAIIAAGAVTAWRAERLPVMSGRYDRPGRPAGPAAALAPGGPADAVFAAGGDKPGRDRPGGDKQGGQHPGDTATMWESLSRGDDPTAAPGWDAGGNNGNTGIETVAEPGQRKRR